MAPSFAYTYFHTSDGNPDAICKLCRKSITCRIRGSSRDTSHLVRHLQRHHNSEISKFTNSSFRDIDPLMPTSFADKERELNEFFANHSPGTVSPCGKESSLLKVDPSALIDSEVPEGSYGLNGGEIIKILARCPVTSKYFKGVKTRDIPIPRLFALENNEFAAYIVNTGYARAGIHWVLALFTPSYNIFFDSGGRSPSELFLETQVKQINTSILYNTKRLQHSKSHVCGHWTIYYTYFLCQGQTLSEINSRFSSNLSANDKIVFNFVKNLAMSCKAPLERYEYATKNMI